jgi:hypothetical protein
MKTILCEPDVANFTKSFKSIGYNHYSAILDLIDNSVSAGATKVWIDYSKEKKGNYKTIIADNGCGMDRNELIEAMRIASSDPTTARLGKDLGKFGLGLKLASFSQTDHFTVITLKKGEKPCALTWDLDFVRKEKKWLLQESNGLSFIKPKSHGTEVILFQVFKGIEINEDQVFAKLRTHIAVVYSMMKGIKFFINDKEIEPIDPFFSDSLASNHSSLENVYLDTISIEIQSHQIPHANKMKPKEKRLYSELNEIGMGPGLYIYRKNRLISWSGWEGLGKNLRINDLYRLAVFCQDDADGLFNIEVKKSQISVSDIRLRTELKSSIIHFSDIARKPYQKRAQLSLKDLSDLWQLEKNSSGKVVFTVNKNSDAVKMVENGKMKLFDLLVMLESTIPYESLLYYLNLNKVDNAGVEGKKIETAEMMFKMGLLTKNELDKVREKYGS